MKSYETPSSISSYEYCERLGGLNKLIPFGGSKSVATVIGNVEHASFQEYYNLFRLDCLKNKDKIFKIDHSLHKIRSDKVLDYVRESYKVLFPSFYQHIIDEIPSLRFRLDLHHEQKLDEIQNRMQQLFEQQQALDQELNEAKNIDEISTLERFGQEEERNLDEFENLEWKYFYY